MLAPDRDRALAILQRHGYATVSFQLLASELSYWFDGDDAFVGYVDTGGAWVAGGPPIAARERLPEVASRFTDAAADAGRRACFFACEQRFVDAMGAARALRIGEQPVWSPASWSEAASRTPSLRYQLRRARAKGVTVRKLAESDRAAIAALGHAWLDRKRMAPMGFLVALEPTAYEAERVVLVAEQAGTIVGFLSAVPVYARRRLFVEHLVRGPTAPNGTTELLVDAAMTEAAARRDDGVTLGLAPLAGDVPGPLRLARAVSRPFYDFRGLRAFKAKLRPTAWEPVYLVSPRSRWLALYDGLAAFARGDLLGFAAATVARRRGLRLALTVVAAALMATCCWWWW